MLFLEPEAALQCVKSTHNMQMFGRTWNANIARNNGRTAEFIKRKEYPNKSKLVSCYFSYRMVLKKIKISTFTVMAHM